MRCIAWLVVVACSSRSGDPIEPRGSGSVTPDAAAATDSLTERECTELIAHAVALGVAEQRQQLPADQAPTEADQAKLGQELRAQFLPACRAGSREVHRCAIGSKTLAELAGCHATPSSSTSNSSVAPPGITPPAPAAP
jgi:hypothetical protein